MIINIELPDKTVHWMANRNGGATTPEKQIEAAIAMHLRAAMMQDPPAELIPALVLINSLCQPVVTLQTEKKEPGE